MSDSEFGGLEPLAGMRMEDDAIGIRLHLVWSGFPPRFRWRMLALAIVAGLLGTAAYAVYPLVADPQQALNDIEGAVLPVMVMIFCLGVAFMLAQGAGGILGYWRELDFNTVDGTLLARRKGWLGFGGRYVLIPLKNITGVQVEATRRSSQPQLELRIYYAGGDTWLDPTFTTVGFDPRGPEQELLYRIGKILGIEGCMVSEHSPSRTQIRLDMDPDDRWDEEDDEDEEDLDENDEDEEFDDEDDEHEDDEAARRAAAAHRKVKKEWTPPPDYQVHPLTALASYSATTLYEQAALERSTIGKSSEQSGFSEQPTEPFDVDAFNAQLEMWRIADWRPGQIIQFERIPAPRWLINTLTILAAIAGGAAGAWLLHGWVEWVEVNTLGRWGTGLYCAVMAAIVARVFAIHRGCARDTTIDWLRREYIVKMQGKERIVPFKTGRRLALWTSEATAGTPADATDERREGAKSYKSVISLVCEAGDVLLFDSDKIHRSRERAKTALTPLAHELSQTLNLPCQEAQDFAVLDDGYPPWLQLKPASWAVLGMVALLTIGIVGYSGGKQATLANAKAAIQATGVEVVTMTAHDADNRLVWKDYQMVRFAKGDDVDAKLAAIAPYLSQLGDCGFDFEQQPLTDAGLAHLANLENLRDLDLTSTKVTDAGLAVLETTPNIVRLGLFGTLTSNEGLKHVGKVKALRILRLGMTQVTDAGLEHLMGLDQLELVHFGKFVDVSPEGIKKLRKQLPGVRVID